METVVAIGAIVLLALVCVLGIVLLVFGFPGTFLILGAAGLYAWGTGFVSVTWATLGWLALLAVVGELLELVLGTGAAGNTRPSRRVAIAAIAGSIAGGLLGAPILLGLGALLGALAGAFLGAGLAAGSEGRTLSESLVHGWGALKGRFFGFIAKSAIAVAMTLLLLIRAVG